MRNFVTELQQRNVLRVATTYALVGWIFIEAGSVLMPTFGAPDWLFKVYVLIVVIGFIAAVILAWVFERTPDGVIRQSELPASDVQSHTPSRKSGALLVSMLVIALGISVTLNVTGLRHRSYEPSIAVLPFTSRSTDPENAVFTDGIHDDLLTRLANVDTLKVISRTSVMDYRDTTKNVRQIAEELGVATILEGAVQRSGNTVRINVQLIDASTDEHIWAKTYDRALSAKNIFNIQSEISAAIAAALKAKLSPQEKARLATVPTENIDAYRLYTAARSSLTKRELSALLTARQQFEQAIVLDPNYALAYAGLADAALLLFINHNAISWDEASSIAEGALEKALELDSELADVHASLGLLKMQLGHQDSNSAAYAEAETELSRAIALNPSHARAYMWLASLREAQGRYDEAISLNKRSLEFDPIGRIPYSNLAIVYAHLGRNEEALNQWLRALDIHPTWSTLHNNISAHLERLGRLDEAAAWAVRARELADDPGSGQNLIGIYVEFGNVEKAIDVIHEIPADHPFFGVARAYAAMVQNDFSTALSLMEVFVADLDSAPFFIDDIASDIAVLAGDLDAALEFCLRLDPEFATETDPHVNDHNDHNAIKFAYLLQKKGEYERARRILEATLPVIQSQPRLGLKGEGIRDVQILALLGRSDAALDTLREAVSEGFRGSIAFDTWTLAIDPYLESIRDRPEFQSIQLEIEAAIRPMSERVDRAEANGDWNALLELARETKSD